MDLITKWYRQCVDFLELFDNAQIRAIYTYIAALNNVSNTYEMRSEVDRVAIFDYLFKLCNNKNGCDENAVIDRLYNILCVMSALMLLRTEYENPR